MQCKSSVLSKVHFKTFLSFIFKTFNYKCFYLILNLTIILSKFSGCGSYSRTHTQLIHTLTPMHTKYHFYSPKSLLIFCRTQIDQLCSQDTRGRQFLGGLPRGPCTPCCTTQQGLSPQGTLPHLHYYINRFKTLKNCVVDRSKIKEHRPIHLSPKSPRFIKLGPFHY